MWFLGVWLYLVMISAMSLEFSLKSLATSWTRYLFII